MASRPDDQDDVRFDVDLARLAIAFAAITILVPAIVAVLR